MVSLNISNQKHLKLIDFIKNKDYFNYFSQKYDVVHLRFSAKLILVNIALKIRFNNVTIVLLLIIQLSNISVTISSS